METHPGFDPAEDAPRALVEQNPWIASGKVPSSLAPPIERPLARLLCNRLLSDEPRRYHVILGPRRVGKTTVMYQTVRCLLAKGVPPARVWWLRMDHPLLMQFSLGQLVAALLSLDHTLEHPVYLMLDELVYADKWDLWLKTFYDERYPVQVVGTSSATAALANRRLESGVGRWSEHYLSTYSFGEYLDLVGRPYPITTGRTLGDTLLALPAGQFAPPELRTERRRFMLMGGFPELRSFNQPTQQFEEPDMVLLSQQVLRSDAVERAIYKDIPQSFSIRNPIVLERLLYVLAGQIAGILSPSNIGRELGIAQPTFDRYLSYLERTYLVFALPNYSGREATVQKRGRKLYFIDGAVRNAALQRGLALLDNPTELGHLLENLVAASLQSLATASGIRMYHWRSGKQKVDLVFDHPNRPLAFEIALSPNHSRAGLNALLQRYPRFQGGAYLVAPQVSVTHPGQSGIGTLPVDLLLLAIGAQADLELSRSLGIFS